MYPTYMLSLNFLVALLKQLKEVGKIYLNSIFYLTQICQCNLCVKVLMRYFTLFFSMQSL